MLAEKASIVYKVTHSIKVKKIRVYNIKSRSPCHFNIPTSYHLLPHTLWPFTLLYKGPENVILVFDICPAFLGRKVTRNMGVTKIPTHLADNLRVIKLNDRITTNINPEKKYFRNWLKSPDTLIFFYKKWLIRNLRLKITKS